MTKILAFDIGGTFAKYGVVNNGKIVDRGEYETSEIKSFYDFMKKLIEIIEKNRNSKNHDIYKIAISSLGTFDDNGVCLGNVENLPFLKGENIVSSIKKLYPEINVIIRNDAVAVAVGEYYYGKGKKSNSLVCITLGTGLGCGIIINGKPIKGYNFRAGEIGYLPSNIEEFNIEEVYSTKAILNKAAIEMKVNSMDGYEFIKEIKNKNPICEGIFKNWMKELGKIIANIILLLDPEYIIVGGGISSNEKLILPELKKQCDEYLPDNIKNSTKFEVAKDGNDSAILGVAAMLTEEL